MVVIQHMHMSQGMPGPSTRIVTIKRESLVSRSVPAPQRSRWQCSICGKLLSSKRSYDEHLNIHNQTRPFTCDHCEYAAASQMTLRRHILRNHTSRDDWHYKCAYCGETYMEPASYQQHVSSRHFGRSATFGCCYEGCTFQTKCSKHFKEHFIKHHNCTASRRGIDVTGNDDTPAFSISDNSLSQCLVDDDLGVGYGRRGMVGRPIVRSNGEIESVLAAAAERAAAAASAAGGGGESSKPLTTTLHLSPHPHPSSSSHSSSHSSSLPSHGMRSNGTTIPVRQMIVVRKTERMDDHIVIHPSTSHPLPSLSISRPPLPPPSSLPLPTPPDHSLPTIHVTDEDFMKAPIALRPTLVPAPPPPSTGGARVLPRRVQLAPIRRVGPPMVDQRRAKREERREQSPVTLGGARHAPAMITGDDWIEHEEIVEGEDPMVYADGMVDFECD